MTLYQCGTYDLRICLCSQFDKIQFMILGCRLNCYVHVGNCIIISSHLYNFLLFEMNPEMSRLQFESFSVGDINVTITGAGDVPGNNLRSCGRSAVYIYFILRLKHFSSTQYIACAGEIYYILCCWVTSHMSTEVLLTSASTHWNSANTNEKGESCTFQQF
jgi:hypothetical protein